jgi:hypothetical protein
VKDFPRYKSLFDDINDPSKAIFLTRSQIRDIKDFIIDNDISLVGLMSNNFVEAHQEEIRQIEKLLDITILKYIAVLSDIEDQKYDNNQ